MCMVLTWPNLSLEVLINPQFLIQGVHMLFYCILLFLYSCKNSLHFAPSYLHTRLCLETCCYLRHNFCHVCNVFDVHVQLLMAIPVPNNEASSSSMMPRSGRSLTEHVVFHVCPCATFSAMHL